MNYLSFYLQLYSNSLYKHARSCVLTVFASTRCQRYHLRRQYRLQTIGSKDFRIHRNFCGATG